MAAVSGQPLAVSLQRSCDALGRPSGLSLVGGVFNPAYAVGYGYDTYGRFSAVSSYVPSVSSVVDYSYLPGSDLIAQLSANGQLLTTKAYEVNRDLITSVANTFSNNPVSRFDYVNDAIGRRTSRVDSASVTNAFGYNARGELTSADMDTNTYGYRYDAIGNRQAATNNSEAWSYVANVLNQYTQISDGGVVTPAYDADGNMTTNGVWAYTWDAENRLLSAESNGVSVVQSIYDYQSRRVAKFTGSATNLFLYDGWNPVAEFQVSGLASQVSYYVWGLDLSGTLQGAGGVGGLLAVARGGVPFFACYDANGNVTEYVAADGSTAAHYEYDPFGNTSAQSGDLVNAFSHRFSTKYTDDETGLLYYGYRYYLPPLGRWLSRDPIEGKGGENIYGFVMNKPIGAFDLHGLKWFKAPIISIAEKAAEIMLSRCTAKKCKESCQKCVLLTSGSAAAGMVLAYMGEMEGCGLITGGWGIAACIVLASTDYTAGTYLLLKSVQDTNNECDNKKSTKAPDCCKE